jgi:O-acetylserine/cysteine efflux transporter
MNTGKDGSTQRPDGLTPMALVAIVLVTAIWGFNFIVIKVGVDGVPPLLLAALRFTLSAFPALLFVKRPAVPWLKLATYGLLLGVGEFGFLFTAIKMGAPAGQSSIILQSQAFFTAILAALALKEKIRAHSVVGMTIAGAGLALIAFASGGTASNGAFWPIAMVLLAAFFWAAANIVAQRMPKTDGLSLMVWSSVFSPLPLFALSFAFERDSIAGALASLKPVSIGALAYLVILSTLFGYGVWNQLIMRHGAKRVAPFSLLVPIFGVASSAIVLRERFTATSAIAATLVLIGLALHVLGDKLSFGKSRQRASN